MAVFLPFSVEAAEKLRVGQHATYARLVFDYPKKTTYSYKQTGNKLKLTFANSFDGSVSPARQLRGYVTSATKSEKSITLTLAPTVGVSKAFHNRKGSRHSVVIDLKKGIKPKAAKKVGAQRVKTTAPKVNEKSSKPVVITPTTSEDLPGADQQTPAVVESVELKIQQSTGNFKATLEFPEGLKVSNNLAVFQRAGFVWIILDKTLPVTPAEYKLETIKDATILRIPLETVPRLFVQRVAQRLTISSTTHKSTALNRYIALEKQSNRIISNVEKASNIVTFQDPLIGDNLLAVTSPLKLIGGTELRGKAQAYPLYDILQTTHGLVVASYGLLPEVHLHDDKVVIGNNITVKKPGKLKEEPEKIILKPQTYLFDYANWRQGNTQDFYQRKQAIQRQVLNSPLRNRANVRLQQAQFLFAHGFNTEAAGVLQLLEGDQEATDLAEYIKPLTAATLFLRGRYTEASKLFDTLKPKSEWQQELNLWHAASYAAQNNFKKASKILGAQIQGIPKAYPLRTTQALVEPLAQTLLHPIAPTESALRETALLLDDLKHKNPHGFKKERLQLLQAMHTTASGNPNRARTQWRELEKAKDRWVAVNARLYGIKNRLENNRVTPENAIKELQRLRFVWRGGPLEYEIVDLLGSLHLQKSDYRQALSTWKQGLNIDTEKTAASKKLHRKIQRTFLNIYQNDLLPPLQALSFFDEFQDFVPEDSEGDAIIQKLADQLVAVDLLSRASDLLQHQVTKRLEGTDKAIVGARLALVQLLDNKPEEALQALELSRGVYMRESLQQHRRYLRARALSMKGSIDAALTALGNDSTLQARRLKAELYWDQQQYKKSAELLQKAIMMQERPAETDILNLALSLSLAGNEPTLQKVAETYNSTMQKTPYGETFALITQPISTTAIASAADITNSLQQLTAYNDFLDGYRKKLKNAPLSQLN